MAHRPFTYTIGRLWHTDPLHKQYGTPTLYINNWKIMAHRPFTYNWKIMAQPIGRLWHTDPLHIQLEDYGTPTLYINNWKIMAHRPFTYTIGRL